MKTVRVWQSRATVLAVAAALAGAVALTGCDSFAGSSAEDHFQSAQRHLDEGEHRAAGIELRNALQKDGSLVEARRALGELRLRSGDPRGAVKEFRRAVEGGLAEDRIAADFAEALLFGGEPGEALALIERVGPPQDANRAARFEVVRGYALRARGDQEQGCAAFDRALEHAPELAAAELGAAECTAVDGRLAQAAGRLDTLLEREPDNIRAWGLLARLELARGRPDAAEAAFERILDLDGRELVARLGLARLRLADGDTEGAQSHIDRVLQISRRNPQGHFLQGLVHFREERLDDARASLQEALNASPDHLGATYFLGAANFAQGNDEQAVHHLRKVLRERPGLSQAAQLLEASERRLAGADLDDGGATDLAAATEPLPGDEVALADDGGEIVATSVRENARPSESQRSLAEAERETSGRDPLSAITGDAEETGAGLADVVALLRQGEFAAARERIAKLRESAPDDARLPALTGLAYFFEERYEAAREAFQAALALDGDLLAAHHGLAVIAVRENDPEAARRHYDAALESSPGNLGTELALFELARRSGDADAARRWLKQAAEDHPEAPVAAGLYGLALLGQGKSEEALAVADRALQANPDSGPLLLLRGDALLAEDRLEDAVDAYEAAAARTPGSVRAHGKLAVAHARRGDAEAVRAALEAALDVDPEEPAVLVPLARLESRQGHRKRALELAERLADVDAGASPGVYLARAEVLARAEKPDRAVEVLQEARDALPESAAIVVTLVRLYSAIGERDAAVTVLEDWVAANPNDEGAWRMLGDYRFSLGGEAGAVAAYQSALEANPDDWQALNNLASLKGEDDPDEGLRLARRAHELAPDSPHVKDTLGWLLLQSGDTKAALELLAPAVEALSEHPTVRYHYAVALARDGQAAAARAQLDSALAGSGAFPEREDAERLRSELTAADEG